MKTVLITGATGLLGSTLVPLMRSRGYTLKTHARTSSAEYQGDLSNLNHVFTLLDQIKPAVIVNLVGLTSVELCQEQPNAAYLANTRAVECLVRWILRAEMACHLVQISTDHVYDGAGPHREDQVTLTNNYAFSKYAGELAAARVPSTIFRTNFIGRSKVPNRESLTDWVYDALINGKYVQVLEDVLFSPLSMTTLSGLIHWAVEQRPVGIFNLGSHNGMSKADFDFAFAECLGLPTKTMSRINSSQATFLKTYRPKDMRMNCKKFEEIFQRQLPNLADEIELAAKDYRE